MSDPQETNFNTLNISGADFAFRLEKLIRKLMECIIQETLAIKSHDRNIAELMRQEKSLLLFNYQSMIIELERTPNILRELDSDLKEHLQKTIYDFEAVMVDNIKTIQAGKNSVGRLIARILDKARIATSTAPKAYNNFGLIAQGHSMRAPATPTKLNETY
jgi:hypothetical protein